MAVEVGKDILVMHPCQDTTPENQQFLLQEVSVFSWLFPWLSPVREGTEVLTASMASSW